MVQKTKAEIEFTLIYLTANPHRETTKYTQIHASTRNDYKQKSVSKNKIFNLYESICHSLKNFDNFGATHTVKI